MCGRRTTGQHADARVLASSVIVTFHVRSKVLLMSKGGITVIGAVLIRTTLEGRGERGATPQA